MTFLSLRSLLLPMSLSLLLLSSIVTVVTASLHYYCYQGHFIYHCQNCCYRYDNIFTSLLLSFTVTNVVPLSLSYHLPLRQRYCIITVINVIFIVMVVIIINVIVIVLLSFHWYRCGNIYIIAVTNVISFYHCQSYVTVRQHFTQ